MTLPITLITGVMASGKSTVAQALAESFERSVHLRGDVFRRMIVRGRNDMSGATSAAALEQLRLRYRLAVRAARTFAEAGFHVVYQDVIIGPVLEEVIDLFEDSPVAVVVLCPSPEVVAQREAGRAKKGYGGFTVDELDATLRQTTPRLGHWIDNSHLTVPETVAEIRVKLSRLT